MASNFGQYGPRWPPRRLKSPRCLQVRPRSLPEGSRRPNIASERPKRAPRGPPREPQKAKIIDFPVRF
eukprot:1505162-Pyramimonas_sp.AAC.1